MPTRKQVIIPYNLYQDLIGGAQRSMLLGNNSAADIREEAPLNIAQQELAKVKRRKGGRGSALGAKNLLYQQRLRAYLRARKRLVDKPVNVRLAGGPLIMMQPSDAEKSGVSIRKPLQSEASSPKISVSSAASDDVFSDEQSELASGANRNGSMSSYASLEEEHMKPEVRQRRQTRQRAESREQKIQQTVEELFSYIKQDPKSFGLTKTGERIVDPGTGKAIANSRTEYALEHIIRGPSFAAGFQSPPGTTRLRSKIRADPTAKKIIESAKIQIGKGQRKKRVVFAPDTALTTAKVAFRPAKW